MTTETKAYNSRLPTIGDRVQVVDGAYRRDRLSSGEPVSGTVTRVETFGSATMVTVKSCGRWVLFNAENLELAANPRWRA